MKFPKPYTLKDIAKLIDCDYVGDSNFPVLGMNEIHVVTSGDIVEGISLLLQLTGSGNADGGGVVYIDDVQVTQL